MATKNISITEEAYNRLARLRKANESFSEIILEVTGKQDISKFFGILSPESADSLEAAIKKRRVEHLKSRTERIKRIAKEMSE